MQHHATNRAALSAQQHQAIRLLVKGENVSEVARQTGVHRGTVHRWIKENADFIAEYNQTLVEARARTNEERRQYRAQAFAVLVEMMSHETVPAATRVRAARHVIELTEDLDESGPAQVTERIVYRSMEQADEETKRLFRLIDRAEAERLASA